MSEKQPTNENIVNYGVKDVKIENHHYVVSVVWKDNKKSVCHFPEIGFAIVNPKTNEKLGYITGNNALTILKEHSAEYNMADFSWITYASK